MAGESAASYTDATLTAASSLVYADDVRELRSKLHEALTDLSIQTSSYTDNTIVSYADDPLNATVLKGVHLRELRTRSTSGTGDSTSGGSSGGLHYVLSDLQGSARTVMNNNGSSSAVIARHDFLPFGEEISSGLGLRTTGQGYNATDLNRSKYGMTERDATSGLDHTWFRKYENLSGRWTSPDPLGGHLGDPQSFNHYSYTGNDSINFIDPTGLDDYGLGPPPPMNYVPRPDVIVTNIRAERWRDLPFLRGGSDIFLTEETAGIEPPQNSFDSGPQGWHSVKWTKCPPVQFKITGIGPDQAPGTTAISQAARADIPNGGVAIKPGNFGVKGVNGSNRSVFLNMEFEVDWGNAKPAGAPSGIPTQGPFFPVDNIGPASVRNSPGNQIDVYNYQKYDDALASTRTAMVTTWIPENTAGVKCPE